MIVLDYPIEEGDCAEVFHLEGVPDLEGLLPEDMDFLHFQIFTIKLGNPSIVSTCVFLMALYGFLA